MNEQENSKSSAPAAFALVADDLTRVEAKMRTNEADLFPPLAEAFLTLMASGGKRLRPAIALLATRLFESNDEQAIALAAAVETLHTATLVHDDVIDNALIRRGSPTLNATWTSGATVLAGDYLFARAAGFAAETGNVQVIRLFAETVQIICNGELRQIAARYQWDQPKDAYYERIYAKTASLFAAATEGAALLGNANAATRQELREVGHNIGMAFQILDDILDFTATDDALGKPAGSDLRQGTVTLPVFYFLQQTSDPAAVRRQLEALKSKNDPSVAAALVAEIQQSPAIAAAFDEARQFIAQAKANLMTFPESESRAALIELAEQTLARRR